jgi:hypothetical protein
MPDQPEDASDEQCVGLTIGSDIHDHPLDLQAYVFHDVPTSIWLESFLRYNLGCSLTSLLKAPAIF